MRAVMLLCVFFLNTFALSDCTLTKDGVSLLRSENYDANVKLHIGANGDMIRRNRDVARIEDSPDVGVKPKDKGNTSQSMCNFDFPLGTMDTNDCLAGHTKLQSRAECQQAADEAKATTDPAAYVLSASWQGVHPKGCFVFPCTASRNSSSGSHASTANCYYYNPAELEPAGTITGTPVCRRNKYVNGSNSGGANSCAAGYMEITNGTVGDGEERCRTAGICLAYMEAAEFRDDVLRASDYDKFPKGCYVSVDGVVSYNMELPGHGDPTGPVTGKPICIVKETVDFSTNPPQVTAR